LREVIDYLLLMIFYDYDEEIHKIARTKKVHFALRIDK
jgi:hypothetical protein